MSVEELCSRKSMKYYNNKAVFVETKGYNCTYTEGPKAVQSRNGMELILVNEFLVILPHFCAGGCFNFSRLMFF